MQESVVDCSPQEEGEGKKPGEFAANLLRQGVTIDIIASVTGLSVEKVQQPQQQLTESQ